MAYKLKLSEETDPVKIERRRLANKLKQRNWVKKYPEKAAAKRKREFEAIQLLISKYKTACSRCGFNDIRALEFHHLDRKKKSFTIGANGVRAYSEDKVIKEIMKCIVLCSNCHRIEELKFYNKDIR